MLATVFDTAKRFGVSAAFLSAAASGFSGAVNTDYIKPAFTFSPGHRYGVMVPIWHDEGAQEPDNRMNRVVELRTGHIVAIIRCDPGYDYALNFHETAPPRWSEDSSLLLWKVDGNGSPTRSSF
jgi:hypothetical protein